MRPTQLSLLEAEGLDPRALAELPILGRAALYDELDLDGFQREAAEAAIRLIQRRVYPRAMR